MRILLIEDEQLDAQYVQAMVGRLRDAERYELHRVGRLGDGIELLLSESFDAVLVDLTLPDAQGVAAVRTLRSAAPWIPIVVLSGNLSEELAVRALQEGAQDYLVKGLSDGHFIVRSVRYAIERKRMEERLELLAKYDPLTGLPNRSLFEQTLADALERSERNGTIGAVLFTDLDGFKQVNDTLGHSAGDELLKQVADRLRLSLRASDLIGRFGGDEFVVVAEPLTSPDDAEQVARRIIAALSQPFEIRGETVRVSTSAGIAMFPADGADIDALTKTADIAMYRAKRAGKGQFCMFSKTRAMDAERKSEMTRSLSRALRDDEMVLHYQPTVDLASGLVTGAEALVRWKRAGIVELAKPAQFIPLAEESGLIEDLGERVLNLACEQARVWHARGHDLRIAVNVSSKQLSGDRFFRAVARALKATGLPPEYLDLELTESYLMADDADKTLKRLRGLGVRLSIDDFGTGYSSLLYLQRLHVDTIKIDRGFVNEMLVDPRSAAICDAVIQIGKSLSMRVIAEGIETIEQADRLHEAGCHDGQGFFFARPMSAEATLSWLDARHPTRHAVAS